MSQHPLGMTPEQFRAAGHELVDWITDYLDGGVSERPVRAAVEPGQVRRGLAEAPPERGEEWSTIWGDVEDVMLPGITHWQHPAFLAYFPANVSYPAILGELLSAGLGVNGMLWSTSPACTELETHVLDWLVELLDLPAHFRGGGVIQDTASSATLCALLAARERRTDGAGNAAGLGALDSPLTVYTSTEAHSSVVKAARIAGIGDRYIRRIPTTADHGMDPAALSTAISEDRAAGFTPCFVSATMGTTSSLALDPLPAIGAICREQGLWLHVDGAMAGAALICPEHRGMAEGLEWADSFCMNPHKWLLTNFDCDAFWVREPADLLRALAILPEYLRAEQAEEVIDYRDWHVPLGRRFRALKLWFVLRSYGVDGLRAHVRRGIAHAADLAARIEADGRFTLESHVLNLVCFRLSDDADGMRTAALLAAANATGKLFATHTKLDGRYVIRLCVGAPTATGEDMASAWRVIEALA